MKTQSIKKTWKSYPVTIRAALIGGVFVLIASICAIIPSLLTIFPEAVDEVRRSNSPPILIEAPGTALTSDINTEIDGLSFAVVPTKCLMVHKGDVPFTYKKLPSITALQRIVITGVKSAIVKEISVVLDNMEAPPEQSKVKEVLITPGMGFGGEIIPIYLPRNPEIDKGFKSGPLSGLEVYSFERDEIIEFISLLQFLEPGQYHFHFEVLTRPLNGDDMVLTSEKISFRWLYVDLENIQKNLEVAPCE